jgi:TonB family protein
MRVVYRGTTGRARSSLSFTVSGCAHGCVLAWVIWGGTGQPGERAQSIYDREIRPRERSIVWYSLREKLPEIAPADARRTPRVPRARVKAAQTMVAGARDDARPAPLIWAAEPDVSAPKVMPLPNVVAVAPPKVVRPFVAPPAKVVEPPPVAALPEGPRAAAEVKAAVALPVTVTRGPVRAFTPPPNVRMQRQAMLPLPEGPQPEMVVEPNVLPLPNAAPRGPVRAFVAPPTKAGVVAAAGLPVAPEAAGTIMPKAGLEKVPRGYLPREVPAMPGPAPAISVEPPLAAGVPGAVGEATLAIVGLNPAKTMEVPAPPGSRAAGFSAGPELRAEGGTGANGMALVNVPGLVVKGGAKDTQPTLVANFSPTSKENLLAAARSATRAAPKVPAEASAPRVAEAPDPRFAGRVVYAIAIQMPNVTSFSGSWLVWFAERAPDPAGTAGAAPRQMRAPEVVRKVDPKYIAAAAAERVEGTVRLFGVIGKDGHVGGMALLRQLDERLDRSAQEALAKWEFTPALRDGVPVDVDAIFEIPFHLAPRPKL